MTTIEKTRRLEVLGRRREKLQRELDEVRGTILEETRQARAAGMSGPKIAAALQVSHQAVYEMLELAAKRASS